MSHYAVLILYKPEQNINELLAPYNENLKVKPYIKYSKEEAIKYVEEWSDPQKLSTMSEEDKLNSMEIDFGYIRDNDNNFLTTYNPNSKWDWWEIGGRFNGSLKHKNGKEVNSAPIKDIQWITPLSAQDTLKKFNWWKANIEQREDEKYKDYKEEFFLYNPEYFKRRYKDVSTYIRVLEYPCYHSVITPDGIWHEPSKMGWWGVTLGEPEAELQWDLNFYNDYIKPYLDSDLIATVVDCHI